LITVQPSNCKIPLVLIKEEENGTLCMEPDALIVRFKNCDRANTMQQWEILKTENDGNNIRICRRRSQPWYHHECLFALSPFLQNLYRAFHQIDTIEPSNEARFLRINPKPETGLSQHWLMNSTTHQLSNVQYPKACITTRHFNIDHALPLVLECNGYGYESPNPQLPKHQSFYLMPALGKNGQQLCVD